MNKFLKSSLATFLLKYKGLFLSWEALLVFFLICEIFVFGVMNPRILRPNILLGSINDFSFIIITAIFVTFVFISGGIDIQAGTIMGLCSITVGILWKSYHFPLILTIFVVLILGVCCGLLSGYIIAYLRVQPMVVTLGGSFLFSGLAINVSKLGVSSAFEGIGGFPNYFTNLTHERLWIFPSLFLIVILLGIIMHLILKKTIYGRQIFLAGVSENAARFAGLNPNFIKMSVYMVSGFGAALGGVLLTSYVGSSRPELGNELTLPIITSVVLGGTLTSGGKGSVHGTILAGFIVGFLRFGLSMMDVPTQYLNIPVGMLLVVVVAGSEIKNKIVLLASRLGIKINYKT